MKSKPLLTIGTVAQLLNVHQRTLRIYEKEGLLFPARNSKNRRLYSYNDLEKVKLILYLTRNLALNLAGVKTIFGLFEELKIKPDEYIELINKVSKKNNFNEKANLHKTSKRGRKKQT